MKGVFWLLSAKSKDSAKKKARVRAKKAGKVINITSVRLERTVRTVRGGHLKRWSVLGTIRERK